MERKAVLLLCFASLMPASTGCSLFARNKTSQLELESERLLSDYRYERERADRLELLNSVLNDRVESLEKRLAINADNSTAPAVAARRQPIATQTTTHPGDAWQPTLRR